MAAEIIAHLTGGETNTNPAASLGGRTSVYLAPADLFADVPRADCYPGRTDYRAVDLVNVGDQGARNLRVWTEGDAGEFAIALTGTTDVSTKDGSTPPWDHGFFPAFTICDADDPLDCPIIAAGRAVRVWLKRTIPSRAGSAEITAALAFRYV